MGKARTRFDIVAVFDDRSYVRYTSRADRPITIDHLIKSLRLYANELEQVGRMVASEQRGARPSDKHEMTDQANQEDTTGDQPCDS
jgi:hypothetical protein